MHSEDIYQIQEMNRTAAEQMPPGTVLVVHAPALYELLLGQTTAKPYILPVEGASRQIASFLTANNVRLDKWNTKTATKELERIKEGLNRQGTAAILCKASPETVYKWGKYILDKDKPAEVTAYAGLHFPEKQIFDCYLKLTGTRKLIDNAIDMLTSPSRLEEITWLHLMAPIAYAMARVPGLKVYGDMSREIKLPAETVLEAAELSGVDYKKFNELKLN